jgi:glyoxylase-like metal-dependent hydrolase (beta-lactamase superfamily II)
MFTPKIYEYKASLLNWFVNAFLVETENGVVLIDGTVGISSGKEIRDIIDNKIKKPLLAVLLTHGHPDHYTGVVNIVKESNIPFYSTIEAYYQAKGRDEFESGDMKIYFGDEYPAFRIFPDTYIKNGDVVTVDNVNFQACDFGGCESDSDCVWTIIIDGIKHAFIGDLIYNRMHPFFGDGHINNWLNALNKLLDSYDINSVFYPAHGDRCGTEMIFWQKAYLEMFCNSVKMLKEDNDTLSENDMKILGNRIKSFLPNDDLIFLIFYKLNETIKKMEENNYGK